MKKTKFLLLVLIFPISACLDPIEIGDASDNPEFTVVDGQFTDSDEAQIVRLSKTQEFGLKSFNPIQGAAIDLCDFTSGQCESYTEENPGIYTLLPDEIKAIEGHEYYVQITLPSGDMYQSTPQAMPFRQSADSVYHRFEKEVQVNKFGVGMERKVINVYLDSKITSRSTPVYMRWWYDELFIFDEAICHPLQTLKSCYIPLDGENQNVQLLDASLLGGNSVNGLKLATKKNFILSEFKNRHYFNVYQQSISKEAFEYWSKVESIIAVAGTIFDPPPASVEGNVINSTDPNDRLLGFFEVTALDVQRTFILPSEFRRNIDGRFVCSQFQRRSEWPAECCNCLNLERASAERPDWVK